MNFSTGHPIVDAVGQLHFSGNIIHHSWYQHIRYSNKRGEFTDPWAVNILADIVYWYRPVEVRDEQTGHLLGYRKKFSEDKLQRSPEAFSELFCCSVKVVREALRLLEHLGLIDIELRAVKTNWGVIPTAMFIGLNPDALKEITHSTSKPESIEKSLLPKSVRRNAEMGKEGYPNGEGALPKSVTRDDEMGESSIYRDFTETAQKTSQETKAPLPKKSEQGKSQKPPDVSGSYHSPPLAEKTIDVEVVQQTTATGQDKSSAPPHVETEQIDVEVLKEIESVAMNWKKRPWRTSAHTFDSNVIRAVWECNKSWYSIEGKSIPNSKKINDRLSKLDNQLKSLNAEAVKAYIELQRYWAMAQNLANPEVEQAFKEASSTKAQILKALTGGK